jgi:V/A-type H+-transporting ATPase subunit D
MAKIKHTKNELKAQREALARFERFLPMLHLKKQQLQAEIRRITTMIEENDAETQAVHDNLNRWIHRFAEPVDVDHLVELKDIEIEDGNIAGVPIPIFRDITLEKAALDLYATPTWLDDAGDIMEALIRVQVQRDILETQRRLIQEELRTTAQRVNLFEKIKIPESKENIRIIKIFLGDEQTSAVVRGKLAKRLTAQKKQRT